MLKTKSLTLFCKSVALVCIAVLLASCGFRPAYAPTKESSEAIWKAFAEIDIRPIPKYSGRLLKNNLMALIQPNGQAQAPKYVLKISLDESAENLSVKKSAFATRANLKIRSHFSLYDTQTNKKLFGSQSEIISGFNIFSEEYATLAAEENARKRAILELAQEIRTRLSAVILPIQ